ncbi:ovochymase-2 precursor [Xenopus laevis]|uniref:Ovochymase-2 n=1 Tax=Xenopus laevis TaxID=8355 RepID=OVCH2_XENLA|nr:ovochymase-2 precursor [Xenopus laevis]P79953.1 RecName: Full=Ovochymase-2; AltName: Full=Oviductal protease; AltName: Full=Oviductin; Flags: Precursor [Xenopus laevis]AAB53972.1 oviductin [Xenopus laevis]
MPTRNLLLGSILLSLAVKGDPGPHRGARCGVSPLGSATELNYLSRIVGGRESKKGQHPWTVSLKRNGKHFCGGTLVSHCHVLTAAHCLLDRNVKLYMRVYIGEYDQILKEETEQMFRVIEIFKHPNFNQSQPMNYDVAVLLLDGSVTFDENIQPACLPNPDDVFEPGDLCVTLGWGHLTENGILPVVLQEVYLPIVDLSSCLHVMSALKGTVVSSYIVCAGFPEGGKDACQGDSGGPLLCQRRHGSWVLHGLTSWGMGCGRSWKNNVFLPHNRKGSPGIFTDIQKLLGWVSSQLNTAVPNKNQESCSMQDGVLSGKSGELIFLKNPMSVTRTMSGAPGFSLSLKTCTSCLNFTHLDIESDFACNLDYLAIYTDSHRLIGKFCGDIPPRSLLISFSSIKLNFFSDFHENRTGFVLYYSAVEPNTYPDSGCGSFAVLFEEGEIQSMNYPENYLSNSRCHWIIHGPSGSYIKLQFEDFALEPSDDCRSDYLAVYQDLAAEDKIETFCGFSLPAPVYSTTAVMHIKFSTDERDNDKGFRATFTFVSPNSLVEDSRQGNMPSTNKKETTAQDSICGVSQVPPIFIYNSIAKVEEAVPHSWPWHTSLQYAGEHVCDGAIIAENWILTTASCVLNRKFNDVWLVDPGIHDLLRPGHNQKGLVKQIIPHPSFSSQTNDFDIALVELDESLQFNSDIFPICLPGKTSELAPASLCVVSGWSLRGKEAEKSTKLQQREVPILTDDACSAHYIQNPGGITDRMLCAGIGTGQDNDSCSEQSGSPLVCLLEKKGIYTIFGIASWGVNCKENSKPGIYTKVSPFIDWIRQIMSDTGQIHSNLGDPKPHPMGNIEPEETAGRDIIQGGFPTNDASSNQNLYIASSCEDVVLLQSPGEIKMETKSQMYPNGFSCQWRIIAPKFQIIKLVMKQVHMSAENGKCCNSLIIYEGISKNKTLKVRFPTDEMVPGTVWSEGSSVTIESPPHPVDPEFGFCLVYSFHSRTQSQDHVVPDSDSSEP